MNFAFARAFRLTVFALALLPLAGLPAQAVDESEKVIKYRQTVMKSLGTHMGGIAAVVKGEVSFVGHVPGHAAGIAAISKMMVDMFPKDSDFGVTRARPEIWTRWDDFVKAAKAMEVEAAKLVEVAGSGDRGAIGAQLGAVGKTCGGCHKPFREKKE